MEFLIFLIMLILLGIILYFTLIKDKDSILNPKIIFLLLWTIIIGLYSLHLFGLYTTKFKYILLIFLGIISFLAGCYIVEKQKNTFLNIHCFSQVTLRKKLIVILGIISIIFFFKNFFISIYLLFQGNTFGQIRVIAQDSNSILNQTTPLLNLVKNFIVLPSATAIEIIAVVDYWFDQKKIDSIFILNLIIICLRVISDGGRTPLFDFFILMISGFLFSKFLYKKKIVVDLKLKITGILSGFGLLIVSLARSGVLLLRHLYLYFAMSPYLFGFWADRVDQLSIYGNGTASLNGFVFSLSYFIKNLTGTEYPSFISNIYDLIAKTDSVWVKILSSGTKANAYVSCFWFFYLDGRVIGILIGMLIYGMLCAYLYHLSIHTKNIRIIALFFLILQGLIFSFIRFPFSKIYYALSIIIIIIAYKKQNLDREMV